MNRKVGLTVLGHQHWLVLVWLPKDKQTNLLVLYLLDTRLDLPIVETSVKWAVDNEVIVRT